MKTAATSGSRNGTRTERGPGREWWKVWVLLTSLGATVLGWMAFALGEPPAEHAIIAPASASAPAEPVPAPVPALRTIEPADLAPPPRTIEVEPPLLRQRSVGTLPAMPSKPVFQAPVTRTRRS